MELVDFEIQIQKEIRENPDLFEEIVGLYSLAISEIHEGNSPVEEFNHCINSINEINGRIKR